MTPHTDPFAATATLDAPPLPLNDIMQRWRQSRRPAGPSPVLFWMLWTMAFLPDLAALALTGWLMVAPEPDIEPAPELPVRTTQVWPA